MKRCPECRRDYHDDSLLYCLDDGTALVEGPATGESKTETLPQFNAESEAQTRLQAGTKTDLQESPSLNLGSIVKGHKSGAVFALLIAAIVMAGFGYGIYRLILDRNDKGFGLQQVKDEIKVQPMTASGKIREAAISPDGKFLVYTEDAGEKTAAYTKQISTNSKVQIVEPTSLDYFALKFSPDGDYVYYGLMEGGNVTIYRVPTLGGPSVKLIENVEGQISFAPGGEQFAVERYDMNTGESAVFIVNLDGVIVHKLASVTGQRYFSASSIAWSPDGKLIGCAVGDETREHVYSMAVIDVSTGEIKEFGNKRFDSIRASVWREDQLGLIFVASDKGSNVPQQVWEMSFPHGEIRSITRDLAGYTQLSMSRDGKTLVTVRRDYFASVWYSASGDLNKTTQVTRGKHEGAAGMTLAPDGRVIYVSTISGAIEIWISNADGSGARQLTNDGISKYTPTVTPDGRYVYYISEKGGKHLWRVNIDGSQPTQVSATSEDGNPRVSPDSKWVVFDSFRTGKLTLWRIPVDGGQAEQLTEYPAMEPDVSPDGSYIAAFTPDERDGRKFRLVVIPFSGGPPIKTFDVPETISVDSSPQWMPDGKGITYIDWLSDVSNLWLQPFDGGRPKQLTNYNQGHIIRREWTRDGKSIAIVRGHETSDAVMITGF